jgi:hypothetical protein
MDPEPRLLRHLLAVRRLGTTIDTARSTAQPFRARRSASSPCVSAWRYSGLRSPRPLSTPLSRVSPGPHPRLGVRSARDGPVVSGTSPRARSLAFSSQSFRRERPSSTSRRACRSPSSRSQRRGPAPRDVPFPVEDGLEISSWTGSVGAPRPTAHTLPPLHRRFTRKAEDPTDERETAEAP